MATSVIYTVSILIVTLGITSATVKERKNVMMNI